MDDLEKTEQIVNQLTDRVFRADKLVILVTLDDISHGEQSAACDAYLAASFVRAPRQCRAFYCMALAALGGPACQEALGAIMRHDPDRDVRSAAITAALASDPEAYVASLWFVASLDLERDVAQEAAMTLDVWIKSWDRDEDIPN